MFSKFSILDESLCLLSTNSEKQRLFNYQTFPSLNEKRKKLETKYSIFLNNESSNNLLAYSIFNPLKIKEDKDNKFKISKSDLNNLFIKSESNRMHKDIYNSKLYDLLNPYHLVLEKKYIKEKYISDLVKSKFIHDKKEKIERGYKMSLYEFYDKKKKIYFGLQKKDSNYNKIENNVVIKNAVENNNILVKLRNESDCFEKILLLKPDFTVEELKLLIQFLYKVLFGVNNLDKIYLYYWDEIGYEKEINQDKSTMEDLYQLFGKHYELSIFIAAEY